MILTMQLFGYPAAGVFFAVVIAGCLLLIAYEYFYRKWYWRRHNKMVEAVHDDVALGAIFILVLASLGLLYAIAFG